MKIELKTANAFKVNGYNDVESVLSVTYHKKSHP
jgi:hypothetical protein